MLRKMKLASKLAVVIGIILTVIFTILILVTATLSGSAITNSVSGELTAIAKSNGHQVQQIFDTAGQAASSMQNYLEKAYRTAEEDPSSMLVPTEPGVIDMCRSQIYNKILTPLNYDVENFLSETARNTAATSAEICGMGAMFEPYQFQDDIRDYAFYVHQNDVNDNIQPYGAYEAYSQEEYYKAALSTGASTVTKPYDYDGTTIVSYGVPIINDGAVAGVAVTDIDIASFNKLESSSQSYPSMYAKVYDNEGTIIYDSINPENVGRNLSEFTTNSKDLAAMQGGMAQNQAFQMEATRSDGKKMTTFFSPVTAGNETWWSLTGVNVTDINQSVNRTVILLVVLAVMALLLLIGITIYFLRKMLRPLQPIVLAAESISNGSLDVSLSVVSEDEIGILSGAFTRMSGMLKKIVGDIDLLLGTMADGNFNVHTTAEESYVGEFRNILLSMRKLNANLSNVLGQINQAADQVSSGSDQVSSGAQALSQGATEQASSVEELAATINEISSHVSQNADNARQASEQAHETASELESGKQQMIQMTEAMDKINQSSSEIGKIIKTIEDISFQTNILALNAAVEAARAGEAGKGFAVVADEVRNLANKSSEASKNTAALIEATLRAVEDGAAIANETAASLERIVDSSEKSASLVHLISDASKEQASSIAQITLGIDQISSVVQTNSATAEESAAASEELSGQAQMLKDLVSQFQLKDTGSGSSVTQPAEQPRTKPHYPVSPSSGTDKY